MIAHLAQGSDYPIQLLKISAKDRVKNVKV